MRQFVKVWFVLAVVVVLCLNNNNSKNSRAFVDGFDVHIRGTGSGTSGSGRLFLKGEKIEVNVHALSSVYTYVSEKYVPSHFCSLNVDGGTNSERELKPFTIPALMDVTCEVVCQVELTEENASELRWHIYYNYQHNWEMDLDPPNKVGFPLGYIPKDLEPQRLGDSTMKPRVYNHVNIVIDYDRMGIGRRYGVVGVTLEPCSIRHAFLEGGGEEGYCHSSATTCPADQSEEARFQTVEPGETILYTYSVQWRGAFPWWSRWGIQLQEHPSPTDLNTNIYLHSIVNTMCIILNLSILFVMMFIWRIRQDIASSVNNAKETEALVTHDHDGGGGNNIDLSSSEMQFHWKVLHADVFCPPSTYPMIYCALVGSGVQLGVSCFIALYLAALVRFSFTKLVVSYILCSIPAGYVSLRLYKTFGGQQWYRCTIYTSAVFPGTILVILLFFLLLYSPASIVVWRVISLTAMIYVISVPPTFLGAHLGFSAAALEFPAVTSNKLRTVTSPPPSPPQPPTYINPKVAILMCGMIPFAVAYVQLYFIMTSLWLHLFHWIFGLFAVAYLIVLFTCAEVTVLAVYYQLCVGNHRWWWFAFFSSGSTSLYIFLYCVCWFKSLETSHVVTTYLVYLGYITMLSVGFFLISGAIGSLLCLWFVCRLFRSSKVQYSN